MFNWVNISYVLVTCDSEVGLLEVSCGCTLYMCYEIVVGSVVVVVNHILILYTLNCTSF